MKSLTGGELLMMAINGTLPTKKQVLEMYADKENWKQVYADNRNYWAWVGPVIVGYEAAQRVLREPTINVK